MPKITKIGHRGAAGYEPENTLRSFRKAIELGVDMVELDVQRCRSGELVVIHDPSVNRTTNGSGLVAMHTLDQLRALDAGRGEKIPTLPEILTRFGGLTRINIELKSVGSAQLAAKIIQEHLTLHGRQPEDFLVSSFILPELLLFKKAMPTIPIGVLITGIPLDTSALLKVFTPEALICAYDFVDVTTITTAHHHDARVFTYTVNQPVDIELMRSLNVDGIISNYPDRL